MSMYSLLQVPKIPKVGPNWRARCDVLRFFIHSVAKIEGDPRLIFEKVAQCRKIVKRGVFSLARYCMLRGKRGKAFLVQFPGPTGTI